MRKEYENNIAGRRTVSSISVPGFGKARRAKCQSKRLISFAGSGILGVSLFGKSDNFPVISNPATFILLLLAFVTVDIQ